MSRKKERLQKWPLVLVEVVGLLIATYLFLISAKVLSAENVPCPRGGIFACHSLLQGRHSKLGPFPIAAMGMAYFAGQLLLTVFLQRKGPLRIVKFLSILGGVAFVAYLRALELLYLHKICPWCYGVALTTLVEAYLAYPLAVPVLPPLRVPARIGAVAAAFAFFIATGCVAGEMYNPYDTGTKAEAAEADKPAKPEPTPRMVKATPEPTARPVRPVETKVAQKLPEPAATPQQTAPPARTPATTPKPAMADTQVRESTLDTQETRILRERGWLIVADTDSLTRVMHARAPILLLAFDPICEECHAFIHETLSKPDLDSLPYTRVAIEESNLEGQVSALVKNVPTVVLLDQAGQARYTHEGRMDMGDLVKNLERAQQ